MLLTLIAQATDSLPITTDYAPLSAADTQAAAGASMFMFLYMSLYLAAIVLMLIGMWKIFEKAGRPGWYCLIPIYSTIVLLQIIGKPEWWFLLMFVPLANMIVMIMMMSELSKSFGKSTGFTLALIFLCPVAMPVLGFGGAKYVGPGGKPMTLTVPVAPQV